MAKFRDIKKNWDYWYNDYGMRHFLLRKEHLELEALLLVLGREVAKENGFKTFKEGIGKIPSDTVLGEKSEAAFGELLKFFYKHDPEKQGG